jgi:hypothetical protein
MVPILHESCVVFSDSEAVVSCLVRRRIDFDLTVERFDGLVRRYQSHTDASTVITRKKTLIFTVRF